jgi:hypothetical protein
MGPLIGAAHAATAGTSWTQLLGILLGSGVISGLVSLVATSARTSTENRRQGYAAAIEAVLAWAEYPYRVRRRTSDDPETLTRLVDLGHELQERRVRTMSWVASENRELYEVFLHNTHHLDRTVGPLISEAWNAQHVVQPSQMVLAGWGSGQLAQQTVERLSCAVGYRTGWRRWIIRPVPRLLRARLSRFLPPTS